METLKGLCVGFHALFGRRSLGLRILITVVTISVCSSAWADTEAHRQAAEQRPVTKFARLSNPFWSV
jgi:hypothetical protein